MQHGRRVPGFFTIKCVISTSTRCFHPTTSVHAVSVLIPYVSYIDFLTSAVDPIAFSDVNMTNRNSLPMRKKQIYCACRDSSKRGDQRFCGLAPRRDALGALHCAEDPSVRAKAHCLWSGGEETCRVRQSQPGLVFWVPFCDLLLLLLKLYSYVSTERCGPSGLLLVSRPEPAPGDCSLVTERCAARASGAK